MTLPRSIPVGWVELADGSFSPPQAVAKGIVTAKPTGKAKQTEAEIHKEILDYCRSKGWPVCHSRMDRPTTSGVGTPDFVIALPAGVTLWIEVKTNTGKLSTEQQAWMRWLKNHDHSCAVVRSLKEFLALVN
jgi:hypothetical protein